MTCSAEYNTSILEGFRNRQIDVKTLELLFALHIYYDEMTMSFDSVEFAQQNDGEDVIKNKADKNRLYVKKMFFYSIHWPK